MDLLVEDAELVADAVADRGSFEGGQRVEVARGEPAEAAVAQPGLLLAREHLVEVLAELRKRRSRRVLDAEVEQIVAQLRAHQELRRQIARHLAAEIERGLGGRHPVVLHAVADGQRSRPVVVLRPDGGRRATDRVTQMVEDAPSQGVGGQSGATALVGVGGGGGWCLDDVGHLRSVTAIAVGKVNTPHMWATHGHDGAMRHEVTTVDELRAIVGHPNEYVAKKVKDRLSAIQQNWLAHSPLGFVATTDAEGRVDVSPKGDPPGFVHIIDDTTIAIPERPGNKRVDGYLNVLQRPHVGTVFLIPGRGDTLRINGTARDRRRRRLLRHHDGAGQASDPGARDRH